MSAVIATKSVAQTGKMIIFGILALILLIFLGILGWRLKNYGNLKGQRDTAIESAVIHAKAAENQADAAKNTGQTYDAIQTQLPDIKVQVDARTEKVTNNASRPVDTSDLDPVGNDSLRELDNAEAAARAASTRSQLRGKSKR